MTEIFSVVTLMDCMTDVATHAWLISLGVPLPDAVPPGRNLAPREIQEVVQGIPGIRAEILRSEHVWQMTVTSRRDIPWASLRIRDYSGDPQAPHAFYFDAGWEEIIVLVCTHLARRCGPLVLLDDSGASPQIIH
jgi:hypothetical protein